ncbi:hypothetical protein FSOLCH5_002802 [Fusarium solani]
MAGATRDRRLVKELGKVRSLLSLPPSLARSTGSRTDAARLAPRRSTRTVCLQASSCWTVTTALPATGTSISKSSTRNPLYKGHIYRLKFHFPKMYPIEPPEVTFDLRSDRPIPMHPHIYSNGIICLDLLGQQGWSPVQSVQSVCMSIQSMLTSNDKNERPPGDEDFVRGNKLRPRDIEFLYHDNTV